MSGATSTPSWRRLIAATLALFGIVFAFLSTRAHAGDETTTQPKSSPEPTVQDPQSQQGPQDFQQQAPDSDPPSTHVS
jgi:hypothetical protein